MKPEYFFLLIYCSVVIAAVGVLWGLTRTDPIEVRHVTNALVFQRVALLAVEPAVLRVSVAPADVERYKSALARSRCSILDTRATVSAVRAHRAHAVEVPS
jgi:hypothetical protein